LQQLEEAKEMNKTMRAAFVKAPFQYEIREVPVPEVKAGWALIQVKACGVCGTDVHIASHPGQHLTQFPGTQWQGFGHEVAGVVMAAGAGVNHVKEGDKVVLESSSFDPTSDLSRNGRVDLSNTAPNFWRNETMGFADYILAPRECLVPFDDLSFRGDRENCAVDIQEQSPVVAPFG
jgi:D-arabinose 1-dehydrogenase-like Zn-dependent alcohol dehydrogenase